MKPSILIYNDSQLQRQNLIDFLMELNMPMEIYEFEDAEEISKKIQEQKFDAIITDIIIKKESTINLIKKIREIYPSIYVVFITAYKNFIMEAVSECHCYDYISKPVNKERFQSTMKLILERVMEEKNIHKESNPKNLVINYNNQSFIIPIDKILFIEQCGYLSIIHTRDGTYRCVSTLVRLYNELNEDFFLTHKSFLVNLKNVSHVSYNRRTSGDIYFDQYDKTALLSVRKKSEFKKTLLNYNKQ
ncbi:MAG: response regulator transcription factor [Epulopiscium sp.]|nr:response regulator transcription factor [Candidatus Epulonipiscium sp.]